MPTLPQPDRDDVPVNPALRSVFRELIGFLQSLNARCQPGQPIKLARPRAAARVAEYSGKLAAAVQSLDGLLEPCYQLPADAPLPADLQQRPASTRPRPRRRASSTQ